MNDKTYLGTGKIQTFDNGGSKIKYACPIDELEKSIALQKADGQTWIRIDICERREPSDKGQTHYGVLDTWKPSQSPQSAPQAPQNATPQGGISQEDIDSIPF